MTHMEPASRFVERLNGPDVPMFQGACSIPAKARGDANGEPLQSYSVELSDASYLIVLISRGDHTGSMIGTLELYKPGCK